MSEHSKENFFFQCKKCSLKFLSSKTMRNHVCKHHDKIDFPQTEPLKQEYALQEPTIKYHHSETQMHYITPNSTNDDEELSPRKQSLEIHIKIPKEEKPLPCQTQDCIQTFPNNTMLQNHMLSEHGVKRKTALRKRVKVKCDQCEYVGDKSIMKRHMIKHSDEKTISCLECDEKFKYKSSFTNHMNIHKGIYNHICNICDKKYAAISTLNNHMLRTHTEGMQYLCQECGNSYKTKGQLKDHITFHTGEKRYKCREQGCEKKFRRTNARLNHERYHKGVREFKCMVCAKLFMQADQLNVHMKRHNGQKDHQCTTCGKTFVEPSGARKCKHSNGGALVN